MLENSERYPLQHILVEDIFSSNKLIVVLLLLILASAMGTIWMTHQTRGLISENGQLVLQHQALSLIHIFTQLLSLNAAEQTLFRLSVQLRLDEPLKKLSEVLPCLLYTSLLSSLLSNLF